MSADGLDPDRVAARLAGIAAEAGRFLAAVPDRAAGRIVKPDGTPATAADLESERMIAERLRAAFPDVAIVGEESGQSDEDGSLFFLVDPLDGTSDYLAGSAEYSVNIALVSGSRPIASALAAPGLGRIWIGGTRALESTMGGPDEAFTWCEVATRAAPTGGLVALGSRRHGDTETARCLAALEVAEERAVSSAVKFGLVASGEADLYVRCGPTSEWDTAAGDHIVTLAGGLVAGPDRRPLTYGHAGRGYLNGPFAAFGDPRLLARVSLPAIAFSPRPGRAGG